MAGTFRWVDEAWWSDWAFWLALVVATTDAVALVVVRDGSQWSVPIAWVLTFGATVAVVGFVRTVVRTFREP